MTYASFVAVVGLALGLTAAAATWAFGGAPGWRAYRRLAPMMFFAAAYCVAELFETVPSLVAHAVVAQRLQAATLVAYSISQFSYFRVLHGPWRFDRAIVALHGVLIVLALLMALTPYGTRPVGETKLLPYGDILYVVSPLRPLGDALAGLTMVAGGALTVRCVDAARKGDPFGPAHVAGTALCLVAGLFDYACYAGRWPIPYFQATSFCLCVIVFAVVIVRRFVADALALEQLSLALGDRVTASSVELVETKDALEHAERTAALGRVAAGVAHEINNPAAAVTANLEYLVTELDEGRGLPEDGADALRESIEVMGRIRRIVRQLLDAGRVGSIQRLEHVAVDELLRQAAAQASRSEAFRERPEIHLAVVDRCPEGTAIVGRMDLFLQVLANLLVNAAQAYPRAATSRCPVRVVTEFGEEQITLVVEDEAGGIPADVLPRIFEPFFTTKPLGEGTGLGLAVTLGIVRSLDGTLDVESRVGSGSRFVLRVRRAVGDAPPARPGSLRPLDF